VTGSTEVINYYSNLEVNYLESQFKMHMLTNVRHYSLQFNCRMTQTDLLHPRVGFTKIVAGFVFSAYQLGPNDTQINKV
jgi:hypothetical protein